MLGEAVDVQGRVPGGGDEDVVLAVVEDGLDARGVGGEDRLRAGAEVDPVNFRDVSRRKFRLETRKRSLSSKSRIEPEKPTV